MVAEESVAITATRVWRLKSPASPMDVQMTVAIAQQRRSTDEQRNLHPRDIEIAAWDGEIRVQYARDWDKSRDA